MSSHLKKLFTPFSFPWISSSGLAFEQNPALEKALPGSGDPVCRQVPGEARDNGASARKLQIQAIISSHLSHILGLYTLLNIYSPYSRFQHIGQNFTKTHVLSVI